MKRKPRELINRKNTEENKQGNMHRETGNKEKLEYFVITLLFWGKNFNRKNC
jgi:hypothetical protein